MWKCVVDVTFNVFSTHTVSENNEKKMLQKTVECIVSDIVAHMHMIR